MDIPAYSAVSTYHIGSLDAISASYERALIWAQAHHVPLRSDACERHVLDIYSTSDENKYVTQILLPILEDDSSEK